MDAKPVLPTVHLIMFFFGYFSLNPTPGSVQAGWDLSNLGEWKVSLPMAGGRNKMSFKGLFPLKPLHDSPGRVNGETEAFPDNSSHVSDSIPGVK